MRNAGGYARAVRNLWTEYKVAAQFSKTWDEVEDAAAERFVRGGWAPPPEAAEAFTAHRARANFRWMEQVEVPAWFRRQELGNNDGDQVWMSPDQVRQDNFERVVGFLRRRRDSERATA